jgi:hypothetical protein
MQSRLSRCFPKREAPLDADAVAKKNEQDERQKVQEEEAARKKEEHDRLEKIRAASFRNAMLKKDTPAYPYPYNVSSCTSSQSAAAPASTTASLPAASDQNQIAPPPPPASVVSQANHDPQLFRDPTASNETLPRSNPQERLAPGVTASQQSHPLPSASSLKDDVRIRQSTRQLLADTAANSKFVTARVSSSEEGIDAIQFTPLHDEYRVSFGRNHRHNTEYPTSPAQPSPIRAQPLQGDSLRGAGLASQIPAPTLAAQVTVPAPLPYSSPNEESAPISSAPHLSAPHETPPLKFLVHHTPPAERHAPPYSNGNLKQITVDFTGKVAQFLSQQDAFTAQNSVKPAALQHSPAPLFGAAPIKAASPKSPRDAARSKIQATV